MTDDPTTVDIQARLAGADRYNRWIADSLRPWLGQRHADFGAGRANVIRHLADRELTVMIEREPEFVEILRREYGADPRVRVMAGDATDPSWPERLKPLALQSASMVNVLEHISDDSGVLRLMRDCLEPGGRIVLFVPAHRWLYGSMDRADGHFRRYTRATLRTAMRDAGFSVEHMRAFNIAGIPAWAFEALVRRDKIVDESKYGAFDRLVPLLSAVERRVRMPIGLSLIAVGRP